MTEPCGPECKWCGGRQRMMVAHPKTGLSALPVGWEGRVVRDHLTPQGFVYDLVCPVQLGAEEE